MSFMENKSPLDYRLDTRMELRKINMKNTLKSKVKSNLLDSNIEIENLNCSYLNINKNELINNEVYKFLISKEYQVSILLSK